MINIPVGLLLPQKATKTTQQLMLIMCAREEYVTEKQNKFWGVLKVVWGLTGNSRKNLELFQ